MEKVQSSTLKLESETLSVKLELLFLEHPSYRGKDCEFIAEKINNLFIGNITAKEIFLVDEPCSADLEEEYRLMYKSYYNE